MTTERVLGLIRSLLAERDLTTSTLEDDELLEAVRNAAEQLTLRRINDMELLTIDPDITHETTYGITPEPTLEQGHMLAYLAAVSLLEETYRGRLNRGELGVSWQSGLESESTISAERAYRDGIDALRADLATLIIFNKLPTLSAGRVQ